MSVNMIFALNSNCLWNLSLKTHFYCCEKAFKCILSAFVQLVSLPEAKLLLKEDDELIKEVFDYWSRKRKNSKANSLIPTVKQEKRDGSSTSDPYVAFRRRTEKMQTRKVGAFFLNTRLNWIKLFVCGCDPGSSHRIHLFVACVYLLLRFCLWFLAQRKILKT